MIMLWQQRHFNIIESNLEQSLPKISPWKNLQQNQAYVLGMVELLMQQPLSGGLHEVI